MRSFVFLLFGLTKKTSLSSPFDVSSPSCHLPQDTLPHPKHRHLYHPHISVVYPHHAHTYLAHPLLQSIIPSNAFNPIYYSWTDLSSSLSYLHTYLPYPSPRALVQYSVHVQKIKLKCHIVETKIPRYLCEQSSLSIQRI